MQDGKSLLNARLKWKKKGVNRKALVRKVIKRRTLKSWRDSSSPKLAKMEKRKQEEEEEKEEETTDDGQDDVQRGNSNVFLIESAHNPPFKSHFNMEEYQDSREAARALFGLLINPCSSEKFFG